MSITIDLLKSDHIGIRDFRDHLCKIFRKKEKPVIITDRGEPVKVLLPYNDMVELLEFLDELTDVNTMRNVHEGVEAIERGTKGISFSRVYKKHRSKSK
ncbi:MAG: type II toxin-antitoxin system Phd/YefM family antitoxin [Candidatus Omnitrophica bacterium]|nr:type II toxin-antitoxin system Phd/YefM family antitoxin [Candidatus Omnitrophota bacterium]MBU0896758.1 type II toxin-antitoxin system Phd/YefM family antitoxin [Candidatus Omnitrophota bacterium]MBU1134009.1 type II toxin-antitoxin system Phd/YefM family antitoxin [Candidatus Omnitrophota bacterium]MBU1810815.1 type II toxin-antitoxin system Phd/YefM family antitoxin [Candidatus Omnitrophota bacterium]